jgi:tetratricopeptide (TPR) repeat protein
MYLNKGDISAAIAGWAALVDMFPDEWKLQTQLGNCFATRAMQLRVVSVWQRFRTKWSPGDHIDNEITIWKDLVIKHPKVWGLQVQLEKAFRKKDDIEEEIKSWKNLIDLHPQEWKLHTELSQAYSKKYPDNDDGSMNEQKASKVEEEIAGWKDLVKKHPDEWELQVRFADAYSRKTSLENTIRIWRKASKRNVSDTVKAVGLVKSAAGRRRAVKNEISDWEELVVSNPHSRGLQMQLELAYLRKGNNDVAIDGWKELVDKFPTERDLALQLKRAYSRKGDVKEEIAGWESLVNRHPKEGTLQAHLSDVYSRSDDPEEEIAGWRKLLRKHPDEPELRDRFLYACIQLGDLEVASEYFEGLDLEHPKIRELPSMLERMFPHVENEKTSPPPSWWGSSF